MSGYLAGKVWRSALEGELKPLAAALADIANDDGTSIYPSVAYICWLLDRSERAVQGWLADLVRRGILKVISHGGGRAKTTEYNLIEDALPKRATWRNPAIPAVGLIAETPQRFPESPQSVPDTPQTEAEYPAAVAPDTSLPETQTSQQPLPCRVCGETGIHTCARPLPKPGRREQGRGWQRHEKPIYRETPTAPPAADWDPEGFQEFFAAYPLQIHEDEARAAWNEMRPPAALVLAGITRWRGTKRWQKNEGEFIPNPEKFLLKKWWRDNPKPNIEGGLNAREELQKKNAETVARVRAKRSDSAAATGVRRLLQRHVN